MAEHRWEPAEYQLQDGTWVPQVRIISETPEGLEVLRLLAPEGRTFDTRGGAKAYSTAMGVKYLWDRGLL